MQSAPDNSGRVMPNSDYQLYRQRSATRLVRQCRNCRLARSRCKLFATRALARTTGPTAASRRDPGVKSVNTLCCRDPPDCPKGHTTRTCTCALSVRAHYQLASHQNHLSNRIRLPSTNDCLSGVSEFGGLANCCR